MNTPRVSDGIQHTAKKYICCGTGMIQWLLIEEIYRNITPIFERLFVQNDRINDFL